MKAYEHLHEVIKLNNLKLWPSNKLLPGVNYITHLNKILMKVNFVNTDNFEEIEPSEIINIGVEKYFRKVNCNIGIDIFELDFFKFENELLQLHDNGLSRIEDKYLQSWKSIFNKLFSDLVFKKSLIEEDINFFLFKKVIEFDDQIYSNGILKFEANINNHKIKIYFDHSNNYKKILDLNITIDSTNNNSGKTIHVFDYRIKFPHMGSNETTTNLLNFIEREILNKEIELISYSFS
jgi:hypothetical protein